MWDASQVSRALSRESRRHRQRTELARHLGPEYGLHHRHAARDDALHLLGVQRGAVSNRLGDGVEQLRRALGAQTREQRFAAAGDVVGAPILDVLEV